MAGDEHAGKRELPAIWAECFLLCDYASVENGKLYIVGGGWEQVTPAQLPTPFAFYIAIKIVVDTELMRAPMRLRIDDVDPDSGQINESVTEIHLDAVPSSAELDAPEFALMLPIAVTAMAKVPGKKRFRLVVEDEVIASTQFRILPPRDVSEGVGEGAGSIPSSRTSDEALLDTTIG